MWHAYSTHETLSNETRVNDLVILTVASILKKVNLHCFAPGGHSCFTNTSCFLIFFKGKMQNINFAV